MDRIDTEQNTAYVSAALAAAWTARSPAASALRSAAAVASATASTAAMAAAVVADDDEDEEEDDEDNEGTCLPDVVVDAAAVVERNSAGIGTPSPSNCDSATYWYCTCCCGGCSSWCV